MYWSWNFCNWGCFFGGGTLVLTIRDAKYPHYLFNYICHIIMGTNWLDQINNIIFPCCFRIIVAMFGLHSRNSLLGCLLITIPLWRDLLTWPLFRVKWTLVTSINPWITSWRTSHSCYITLSLSFLRAHFKRWTPSLCRESSWKSTQLWEVSRVQSLMGSRFKIFFSPPPPQT